jgi:hypothetical protein
LGERVPVEVNLILVGARDRERHRLGEGKLRSAVDGLEGLPIDLKLDEHHWGVGIRAHVAEPIDMQDSGVLEDRDVVIGRFFGVAVEPEARGNQLRHGGLLTAHAEHVCVTERSASDLEVASI